MYEISTWYLPIRRCAMYETIFVTTTKCHDRVPSSVVIFLRIEYVPDLSYMSHVVSYTSKTHSYVPYSIDIDIRFVHSKELCLSVERVGDTGTDFRSILRESRTSDCIFNGMHSSVIERDPAHLARRSG